MRERLASLLLEQAQVDPKFLVLSGDHGYALFNPLREGAPDQFVNVGVCEQAMIGYAAGLSSLGFKPLVYGLAAFVPLRVLEQIKLDLCQPHRPVVILGDGAGLVYSTLGSSHQCAEDVAAMMPLPGVLILSPCDTDELELCFKAALAHAGPSYIRIGKSDSNPVRGAGEAASLDPHWLNRVDGSNACIVVTGAMARIGQAVGKELGVAVLSVPCLKPLDGRLAERLRPFNHIITVEEHNLRGGLYSALCEALVAAGPGPLPQVTPLALKDQFSQNVGSHQYALSEHGLDDAQIRQRIRAALKL